ncbi:MAG: TonB-dependent receptor [Bacteroidales bacterium]|nr:TonB-dependent receptor [Candidatus Cryptobacteroides aphodequi]
MKRFPNKSLFFHAALFLFHPAVVAQTIHLRDSLESVIVTATRTNSDHYVKPGLTKLGETDFSRGAALLGTPDIIKTLHTLPGTASGAEIFSGLFVRGGDGSDNLYLLDGVPLYQVSHLGGLFSSFNTDAVSGLNFYTGGFPAKYGGRLSSVVDVTTKEGDYEHYHGVFSMGLIDGRVRLEGPIVKNKISFAVSARRTWLDLIAAPALKLYNKKNKKDLSEDYQFSDINARIDFRLSDKDKLSFHYYTGGDKLLYDEKRNASNHQKAFESTSETEMAFKCGNSLYSASYRHNTDDGLLIKITGYCSDNRSDMAYDYYVKAVSDGIESLEKINEGNFGRVTDFGATAQASYYTGSGHDLNAGATLVWHKYNPSRTFVKSNGGEDQKQSFALPYDGSEWAVYASDAFQLGGFVMADLGLRYSGYSADGTDYSALEPRMTLSADLSRNISLTLAYSKMAQYSHLVAASFLDLPTNLWMPSTAEVGPMMSDLYSAGICYRPGSSWFMDIQGYYKHMSNLLYYDGVDSVFPPIERWNDSFSRGTGRAYGAECQMEYRSASISAALYYTLS